jgi:hypothetical protein
MTTPINDLSERLESLLQAKGHTDGPYDVSCFNEPDKSDPLNEVAIMSAVAIHNGVKRGWWVKTSTVNIRGGNRNQIIKEKLLAKLAEAIVANPDGQGPAL